MKDLSVEDIESALHTERYGRSLELFTSTESTMDDGRRAAEGGAPDGHTVIADEQRTGRGAHGHHWDSPGGTDLYVSIVARPKLPLAQVPPLTLAVGLGVREVLSARLPNAEVTVKWPNDVWVDGRKCAGVLVETRTVGSELDAAIVGIGINVNRTEWPAELRSMATSVAEALKEPVDRSALLAQVLEAVEQWVDRYVAGGSAAIVGTLDRHLALRGRRVHCNGVTGTLLGIAAGGGIQVETDSGTVELLAGTLVADG